MSYQLELKRQTSKTVVTIHDLIYLRYPKLFTKIDRKIYDKKFRSACERADKIIAVSKQTKSDIIEFFNINEDKIDVVYQGCNQVFKTKKVKMKFQTLKINIACLTTIFYTWVQ